MYLFLFHGKQIFDKEKMLRYVSEKEGFTLYIF